VTLQSSEVRKISKEEYMKGMTAPPQCRSPPQRRLRLSSRLPRRSAPRLRPPRRLLLPAPQCRLLSPPQRQLPGQNHNSVRQ
jgi:hypothetical protein